MKKYLVALAPIAAVAAMALAPSSALAAGGWGGWTDSHQDNAASPDYWQNHFGNDGFGDSQYCVNPGAAYNTCSGGVTIPLYFTGAQAGGGLGCGHYNPSAPNSDGPNPCLAATGDVAGGVYGGTCYGGTEVGATPVYMGGSGSEDGLPCAGVGAQG